MWASRACRSGGPRLGAPGHTSVTLSRPQTRAAREALEMPRSTGRNPARYLILSLILSYLNCLRDLFNTPPGTGGRPHAPLSDGGKNPASRRRRWLAPPQLCSHDRRRSSRRRACATALVPPAERLVRCDSDCCHCCRPRRDCPRSQPEARPFGAARAGLP